MAESEVNSAQSTLSDDQTQQFQACAGTGTSSPACSQATEKVSQDQTQLTQADQQLAAAQATATGNQGPEPSEGPVGSDQVPR